MINIWLALREDAELELQEWLQAENLSEDQEMVKDAILSHPDYSHIVQSTKRLTDQEGKTWGAYSMYIGGSQEALSNVAVWLTSYAGKVVIGGCWNMDGTQFGMYADEEGNIAGVPLYPVDIRMLGFMPNDVQYDAEGVEVSNTPAVELKQINLMAGQQPRDFTVY